MRPYVWYDFIKTGADTSMFCHHNNNNNSNNNNNNNDNNNNNIVLSGNKATERNLMSFVCIKFRIGKMNWSR